MASSSIWLRPTPQLDVHHPKLHFTGLKLTQSHQSVPRRVEAIRDFVRRMPSQVSPDRVVTSASAVLDSRSGDCHTKGLLFTALCRTCEIPARLRFVRIRTGFLKGLLDYAPETVTHAVGQALVDGKWVNTDTYVIDPPLFVQALSQPRETNAAREFASRLDRGLRWDGRSDAIQHFRPDDIVHDYGPFDDVAHFHRSEGAGRGWWPRVKHALESRATNRRVDALRRAAPGSRNEKTALAG